jgi:hypothetical protein
MKYLEIQPLTETRVMNFRSASPKLRRQRASNSQVIKLKLDKTHFPWKIATDITRAHEQASDFASLDLRFD